MRNNLNYEATGAYYKANGMQIYSITTADEYSQLKNWLTSLFGVGSGAGIWINAMLINGQWVTSDGKPLFIGAIPTKHLGEGNCVIFSNFYGSFELIVRDCAVTPGSVGEFFDITKETPTTTKPPTSKFISMLTSNILQNYFSLQQQQLNQLFVIIKKTFSTRMATT